MVKQIKAKGESKTNIFIKTYLIEYVIVRLKRPKDKKLFIRPSKENTSIEDESIEITEFKFWISFAKHIDEENSFSPICRIEEESREII